MTIEIGVGNKTGEKKESNLLVLCAWCPKYGKEMTTIKEGDHNGPISHGLCKLCAIAMREEYRLSKGVIQ